MDLEAAEIVGLEAEIAGLEYAEIVGSLEAEMAGRLE